MVGRISPLGIDRKNYFIILTDDFSRYRWCNSFTTKDGAFLVVRDFFQATETQFHTRSKSCNSTTKPNLGSLNSKSFSPIMDVASSLLLHTITNRMD